MEDTEAVARSARTATVSAMERLRNRDKVAGVYPLVLDRTWAGDYLKTTEELDRLTRLGRPADDPRVEGLAARKAELEAQKGEAVLEFKFRHCSPVRHETLLSEHRPTEAQREEAKGLPSNQQPRWAPTFRPAFVGEVLLEPELTAEEIAEIFQPEGGDALLSPAEAAELFMAALMASNTVTRFEPDGT